MAFESRAEATTSRTEDEGVSLFEQFRVPLLLYLNCVGIELPDAGDITLRAEGLAHWEIGLILGMPLGAGSLSLARSLARISRPAIRRDEAYGRLHVTPAR